MVFLGDIFCGIFVFLGFEGGGVIIVSCGGVIGFFFLVFLILRGDGCNVFLFGFFIGEFL